LECWWIQFSSVALSWQLPLVDNEAMGQNASCSVDECHCQDGLLQFCVTEDPHNELQSTIEPTPVPGYPMQAALSELPVQSLQMKLPVQGGIDFTSEETAYVAAPPPPGSPTRGFPPLERNGSPSPETIRKRAAALLSTPQHGVTVDDILSNIDGAEEALYGEAFMMFPGGRNGFVGLDSAAMREFLCTNTAISMEDIDMELLKVSSPDDGLNCEGFLHLLREFPFSDGDSLSHFMGMSADGESLGVEECRSGLLLFAQEKLSSNFTDERWECIFNTVMWDAGVTVMMEQWLTYCKLTGRILRLLRYAQVQKLADHQVGAGGRPGIRGGA